MSSFYQVTNRYSKQRQNFLCHNTLKKLTDLYDLTNTNLCWQVELILITVVEGKLWPCFSSLWRSCTWQSFLHPRRLQKANEPKGPANQQSLEKRSTSQRPIYKNISRNGRQLFLSLFLKNVSKRRKSISQQVIMITTKAPTHFGPRSRISLTSTTLTSTVLLRVDL